MLRVDAVGSLDLAVEPGCSGLDVDVVDGLGPGRASEGGLELATIVSFDHLYLEWELLQHVVDELDDGGCATPQSSRSRRRGSA
jgi:hypothetical protein